MATKRKTTAKKTQNKTAQDNRAQGQVAAVILLALAILVTCILLIEGGSLWGFLNNVLFGLLGWCVFFVPLLMVYIAVMLAREKAIGSVSDKLWQGSLLIFSLSSTVHIFFTNPENGYFAELKNAYVAGTHKQGGGLIGALLGDPMERLFTDVGAKIILILILFVFLMLTTGTGLVALFRFVLKPVQKTKKGIQDAANNMREHAAEPVQAPVQESAQPQKPSSIDVGLGHGYADDPKPKKSVDIPLDSEMPVKKETPAKPEDKPVAEEEKPADNKPQDSFTPPAEEKKPESTSNYQFPPITLLKETPAQNVGAAKLEEKQTADLLVQTLKDFGVSASVVAASRGPAVTRYELEPSAGVKLSRITGLSDDIALRLATTGVRMAPVPNKSVVGIEVPNRNRTMVGLRDLIDTPEFASAGSKLTVALGRDIAGKTVLADLAKMPHLLIAGTTGSGKSVCTNTMIQSVLFRASPEEVRLLLIDPKMVEFGVYNGIPHLLVPVVTDPRKAAGALGWAVTEMLARYKAFSENNVRNLTEYNELAATSDTLQKKPQILIVIDELSDLMMAAANEVEDAIVRLAQMARAAGMHLVIATQRPSVDVITGLIKANIPSRLALTVASGVDSRTILDSVGAEKLLGHGDMLFMPLGTSKPLRVQGGFVDSSEIEAVVNFLKNAADTPAQYDDEVIQEIERQASAAGNKNAARAEDGDEEETDDMLPQAIEVVVEAGMASTSLLQRKLRLGYARAGRLVDIMEQRGIVGPHEGSKPRQVLITRQQWLEMNVSRDE